MASRVSAFVSHMSLMFSVNTSRFSAVCSRFRMISLKAKRPIATTTKLMPSASSGTPRENRATPLFTSVPTSPKRTPSRIIAIAFSAEPCASVTAMSMPTTRREKYSAGPNWKATSASTGAKAAMITVDTQPAKKEPSAEMVSAAPARPLRAIWYPSMQVTTDEDSPGRFTRMEVVEPPYWAP